MLLNPANTGSKNGGFAAPGYPVSFANTLSPFPRLKLAHNMNVTRPVMCSPGSSLSYSPLPRTFVPFLTEKGWVMMPADQVGSPMPPGAKGTVGRLDLERVSLLIVMDLVECWDSMPLAIIVILSTRMKALILSSRCGCLETSSTGSIRTVRPR